MNAAAAITGLGTIGSYGCGRERLADALRQGSPSLAEVERSAAHPPGQGARLAALACDRDLSAWLSPPAARRMSPPSKMAVAAARMALEDAGLPGHAAPGTTAVILSTTFGAVSFSEKLYRSIHDEGPESASPFLFTECVANAPAAQVAIHCHATGPNITIVQREAGGLIALARGCSEVLEGRATRALVGAVDEITPLVHGLLDRFGALARARDDAPECSRPFDRWRNGLIAAEGATVLVLEDANAAEARGAQILARVITAGGAFDATASRVGWGHGDVPLAKALVRMLARVERVPNDIDRIVSGANGSLAGDRLEGRMLREAWGDAALPPVIAPKGVTGEYGGGFLAAAVLGMLPELAPTAGFSERDPAIGVVPYVGGALRPPRTVLASALAAGGAAAWALFEAA